MFYGLVLNLVLLALGLAALAYDSNIADALNVFPYLVSELARRRYLAWFLWKYARVSPPSGKVDEIETWLRLIRFWAISMIAVGFLNAVLFLIII